MTLEKLEGGGAVRVMSSSSKVETDSNLLITIIINNNIWTDKLTDLT